MSCFLFGDLVSFTTRPSFEGACEMAKTLLRCGSGTFYLKFGGNVSHRSTAVFPGQITGGWHLSYEITDSILENTADRLASPKTCTDAEPWNVRKASLLSFVHAALALPGIEGMTLNLNLEESLLLDPSLAHICRIEDLGDLLEAVFSEDRPYLDPTARIWIHPAGPSAGVGRSPDV